MSETITATFVKDLPVPTDFRGTQKLWRLSGSVDIDEADNRGTTQFVVTSAAYVPFSGPETYIFAADESGRIVAWCEMAGSFRGHLDHEYAVKCAGWSIVP